MATAVAMNYCTKNSLQELTILKLIIIIGPVFLNTARSDESASFGVF